MKYLFVFIILLLSCVSYAQKKDTLIVRPGAAQVKSKPAIELLPIKPGVAIRRSAIIPGWGQATNKKYWKIPVVYAALGTTAWLFLRNLKQYKEARDAYRLAIDTDTSNDYQIPQPYYTVKDQPGRIKNFRDEVRQNLDYSALFFILFWGLNVVDAAVDAHLRTFDVNDNLSLYIKAGHSDMAKTNGISLILSIR